MRCGNVKPNGRVWPKASESHSHLLGISMISKFFAFVFLFILTLGVAACGVGRTEPTGAAPTALPAATATTAPTTTPAPTMTTVSTPTVATEAAAQSGATATQAQPNGMLSIIAQAKGLENFGTLLQSAGLTAELQGKGPVTLFVFPNRAWDELPPAVVNNPALVRQILLNHIAVGHLLMADMVKAGTVASLGDELTVLTGQEGATVQGSNVLDADYAATDGVLHLLDTVILPQAVITDVMALYPAVVGEQTYPMQGNVHIANGQTSPAPYNSVPPTSGPHFPNIVAWQVYSDPFRYEQLIHNLEDSGVIIYYQCATPCPALVDQLRAIAQPYMDAGRHVVVAPNDPTLTLADGSKPHADMGAPIAVVAWRKLLKLNEVDAEKIGQFIEAFEGIDHHVK
jgi:uncharacterized surface protein with fasciclin (FAS1) repeats